MRRALAEYQIIGARTTLPFARWLMEHPRYIAADFSTDFIAEEWETRPKEVAREQQNGEITMDGGLDTAQIAAIVGGLLMYEQVEEDKLRRRPAANGSAETSRWREAARKGILRGL